MKSLRAKKLMILAAIMVIVTAASTILTKALNTTGEKEHGRGLKVVTSFYPLYIATKNVTEGIEDVTVVNLMQNQQGCLHDYQLTTDNMRTLENADVLIINGAGMEAFLGDIQKNYPNLPIIDASEGIDLLTITGEVHEHDHADEDDEEAAHEHDHADEDEQETHEHDHADEDEQEAHEHGHDHEDEEEAHTHDHGEYNPHVWLDPARYEQQITTIAEGLARLDTAHAAIYERNESAYKSQVEEVRQELADLPPFDYDKVILFHNSMEYLLQQIGVEVAYCLNLDGETSLSAGQIAEIIKEIQENDIKVLFSEEQYSDEIAERIGEQTGAKGYVFDSLVTGGDHKDAYITGMRHNIKLLKKALYQ